MLKIPQILLYIYKLACYQLPKEEIQTLIN